MWLYYDMNEKSGIYHFRNTVNGKIYVGQTSNLHVREGQHRYKLHNGTHTNPHLQAAWYKYGADAFVFEPVLECALDDLFSEETKAWNAVPSHMRYNLGPPGASPTLGVKKRKSSKLKQSRSKGGRAFFATNIQTEETFRFEHVGEALVFFKRKTLSVIYRCLHGKKKFWRGFVFRYDPTSTSVKKPYVATRRGSKRNRAIVGTAKNGTVIRFDFIAASRVSGFEPGNISRCLRGVSAHHKGFVWRYEDGLPHAAASVDFCAQRTKPNRRSRPVVGTHVSTGEQVTFPSLASAGRAFAINPALIHHCISGKMKFVAERTWCHAS